QFGAGLGEDLLHPVRGEVPPGDDEQALVDAERRERIAMVAGLRLPALIGRDDEAHDGGGAEPGEHVAQEALMTGDVHEGHFVTRGQGGPGEAEVDGQAAPSLLGPAVRLDPGEGPDQGGLAVIDVSGGGDDLLHRRCSSGTPRAAATARTRVSSSSAGTQRRSSRQSPSRTVATTAGSPVRSGGASSSSSATAQPGSGTSAPPPPPTRPSCGTRRPPSRWASR